MVKNVLRSRFEDEETLKEEMKEKKWFLTSMDGNMFCYVLFPQPLTNSATLTAKNTLISPDFLVWKFCGKAQFPHSFGQIAQNYAETVPFRNISTPGNRVKWRYFRSVLLKYPLKGFFRHIHTDFMQALEATILDQLWENNL